MRPCPNCPNGRLKRIARTSFGDFLFSIAGFLPYRCNVCKRQALGADWGRVAFLCACAVVVTGLGAINVRLRRRQAVFSRSAGAAMLPSGRAYGPALTSIPQSASDNVLTNEDVAAMGQVQMPSTVVNKLIRSQRHRFLIDAKSLVALKKAGVPEEVILTMIEVTQADGSPDAPADGLPTGPVHVAAETVPGTPLQ